MSIELSKTLHSQSENSGHARLLSRWLKRWLTHQSLKLQIQKERRDLASLTVHQLRDIGIDAVDARNEYNRSYSDLPSTRIPDTFCDHR